MFFVLLPTAGLEPLQYHQKTNYLKHIHYGRYSFMMLYTHRIYMCTCLSPLPPSHHLPESSSGTSGSDGSVPFCTTPVPFARRLRPAPPGPARLRGAAEGDVRGGFALGLAATARAEVGRSSGGGAGGEAVAQAGGQGNLCKDNKGEMKRIPCVSFILLTWGTFAGVGVVGLRCGAAPWN